MCEQNKDYGFYVYNKPRFFNNIKDRRNKKYKQFKKENGFTPDETWSLYTSIAIFVLPRLKHFRENTIGYCPYYFKTLEAWHNVLDKMIFSFENILKYDDDNFECPKEYLEKHKDQKSAYMSFITDLKIGFKLFGKHFMNLWW